MNNRFGKEYKLCSKIKIERTYRDGRVAKAFPFFAKYLVEPNSTSSFEVVFVVPKKKFRFATKRNRIRRYIRESVRLEKNQIEAVLVTKQLKMYLFLAYNGNESPTLVDTQKAIRKLFKNMKYEIENQ